jgi:hypothetical protein
MTSFCREIQLVRINETKKRVHDLENQDVKSRCKLRFEVVFFIVFCFFQLFFNLKLSKNEKHFVN